LLSPPFTAIQSSLAYFVGYHVGCLPPSLPSPPRFATIPALQAKHCKMCVCV
jgi:hypothetical protein